MALNSAGTPTGPVRLDGALGEGGGQVLRTALALSLATGRPFDIVNIRAKRAKPGLLRQHLTAVNAAAAVSSAEVEGAEPGSQTLRFRPGAVRPGEYAFQVGTAGSACLVAQTILLPLALAGGASSVVIEGGTHNPAAPPFDHLAEAWLPHLRTMGFRIDATLERAGFYPAGGGRLRLGIAPAAAFRPLVIEDRGAILVREARAVMALIPRSVGDRELDVVVRSSSLLRADCSVVTVDSPGPGNVLLLTIRCEGGTEVFTGFGEHRRRAESVAAEAVDEMREWHASGVPVGRHLADQLLLPMALAAGGSFRTLAPTMHTTTNCDVIAAFLGDVVTIERGTERGVDAEVCGGVRTSRVVVRGAATPAA
ncbi:MAG: RNA 3'-terminal phosphate cyclase [Planctomycetes bacterium]|nr:RNA 3'-terminal phosphate cyclase [Planctomycetota bacterium]